MKTLRFKVLAYFYPGWVRSRPFDEWSLVVHGQSAFPGHRQPKIPVIRYYLETPEVISRLIEMAISAGVDGFVFCWYWDNGRLYLSKPLKIFLQVVKEFPDFCFALMWANRIPHQSLPISAKQISGDFYEAFSERVIKTDEQNIREMTRHCRKCYFQHPNYFHINGSPYFSVFSMRDLFASLGDADFLVNGYLKELFGNDIFLTAISHGWESWLEDARRLGIKALTSYVLLPDWHGPKFQDYCRYARRASLNWKMMMCISELPTIPSVTTGWDASCRGKEAVQMGKDTYPWSPIVINESPGAFEKHLKRGFQFAKKFNLPAVMISSWNEWSEGHYIEPDTDFGDGWLRAVLKVKKDSLKDFYEKNYI